mmetsp:Transcript_3948/g.2671  ORF Transcript_3948/g.2671 Transcript_3948/m.2671 type:complete len:90 (+) Transcript_3948:2618-2887(+)
MHFKEESISSGFYSSPFFITVFSNVLQGETTSEHMWKLLRLWDYFIIYGWKAIFKITIITLRAYEDQMLDMAFENLLPFICNLPNKYLL